MTAPGIGKRKCHVLTKSRRAPASVPHSLVTATCHCLWKNFAIVIKGLGKRQHHHCRTNEQATQPHPAHEEASLNLTGKTSSESSLHITRSNTFGAQPLSGPSAGTVERAIKRPDLHAGLTFDANSSGRFEISSLPTLSEAAVIKVVPATESGGTTTHSGHATDNTRSNKLGLHTNRPRSTDEPVRQRDRN